LVEAVIPVPPFLFSLFFGQHFYRYFDILITSYDIPSCVSLSAADAVGIMVPSDVILPNSQISYQVFLHFKLDHFSDTTVIYIAKKKLQRFCHPRNF
jgi:hypothetical protein